MESKENHDYSKLANQEKVVKLLEDQKILFSDKIKKINQNGWSQDRTLCITNEKVFNIHKTESKRDFKISLLTGLSINTNGGNPEFTLHVGSEYDYRFVSKKRDIIIKVL